MSRTHGSLRAAFIPLAAGALVLGSALGAAAQSPDTSAAASGAPATIGPECAKDQLSLKNPGRLTLSTDNPAYPPWWGGTPPSGSDWSLGYPPSGEGYEGAVAAAIAKTLGFTPDEVDWLANTEFTAAFAPGDKPFDFHLAQISIKPERAQAVDFSDPYFDSVQSIVALTSSPIQGTTTIEGLKGFKLGAAQGTTSLQLIENVIQPTTDPSVFNSNDDMVTAIKNGQIDGGVADLYSAIYMRDAQLENYDTPDPEASIVGQFSPDAQIDQMGIVFQKGSALRPCVNEALAVIKTSGQLQQIYDQWIGGGQEVPTFQ
jgi:polar amino acid transport system substrate-binding protein